MSATIAFSCKHCGRSTKAPAHLEGRMGRCGGCKSLVRIGTGDVLQAASTVIVSEGESSPNHQTIEEQGVAGYSSSGASRPPAPVPSGMGVSQEPLPVENPGTLDSGTVPTSAGWPAARFWAGGVSLVVLGSLVTSGAWMAVNGRGNRSGADPIQDTVKTETNQGDQERGVEPPAEPPPWTESLPSSLATIFDQLKQPEPEERLLEDVPLAILGEPLREGVGNPDAARDLIQRRAESILWLIQPTSHFERADEMDYRENGDGFVLSYMFRYRTLRYHKIAPDDLPKDLLLEFEFAPGKGLVRCQPVLFSDEVIGRPFEARNDLSYHLAGQVAEFVERKMPPLPGASYPRLGEVLSAWGREGGDPGRGLQLFLNTDDDQLFAMLGFATMAVRRVDGQTPRNLPADVQVALNDWRGTTRTFLDSVRKGNSQTLAQCYGVRAGTINLVDLTKGDKDSKMKDERRALWESARYVEVTDRDLAFLQGWLSGMRIKDADRHDDPDEIEVDLIQTTGRNEYRNYVFLHRDGDAWRIRDAYYPRSLHEMAADDPKGPQGVKATSPGTN